MEADPRRSGRSNRCVEPRRAQSSRAFCVPLVAQGRSIAVTRGCTMSQSSGTSKALVEIVVAVVLVVAVAAIVIGVLGWLAGAFWWLVKLAVIALVIFVV